MTRRAVSFAAAGAIGRSWRLVTLDDDRVKAVGGAAGPRRLAGVTALIALEARRARQEGQDPVTERGARPVPGHRAAQRPYLPAAVAIIDISVPSENLRWEIDALLPVMGRRCVLVGRLDLLTTPSWDGRTVFTSPLEHDIDGHEVLAYRPGPAGVRHFSRALKATIEARAHGR